VDNWGVRSQSSNITLFYSGPPFGKLCCVISSMLLKYWNELF